MLRPIPTEYRPPRGRVRPRPAAPVVMNQITSVAYGPAPEVLVVTVAGTLAGVGEVQGLLSVSILGNEYTPIEASLDEAPLVVLTFDRDVTDATAWTVPDPASWLFEEGELAAPFGGEIE